MNAFHNRYCASNKWKSVMTGEILPWVLDDVTVSEPVLEVGPGPGIVVEALLASGIEDLTALEIEAAAVERLRHRFGDLAEVVTGDGAAMPLPDNAFATALSCTMLHHVPTAEAQDAILREVFRVLRPGGVFAGSDGRSSLRMRLYHLRDTFNPVDPSTLGSRLEAAGFQQVRVDANPARFRFRATKG